MSILDSRRRCKVQGARVTVIEEAVCVDSRFSTKIPTMRSVAMVEPWDAFFRHPIRHSPSIRLVHYRWLPACHNANPCSLQRIAAPFVGSERSRSVASSVAHGAAARGRARRPAVGRGVGAAARGRARRPDPTGTHKPWPPCRDDPPWSSGCGCTAIATRRMGSSAAAYAVGHGGPRSGTLALPLPPLASGPDVAGEDLALVDRDVGVGDDGGEVVDDIPLRQPRKTPMPG